jgi:hypothetical protein
MKNISSIIILLLFTIIIVSCNKQTENSPLQPPDNSTSNYNQRSNTNSTVANSIVEELITKIKNGSSYKEIDEFLKQKDKEIKNFYRLSEEEEKQLIEKLKAGLLNSDGSHPTSFKKTTVTFDYGHSYVTQTANGLKTVYALAYTYASEFLPLQYINVQVYTEDDPQAGAFADNWGGYQNITVSTSYSLPANKTYWWEIESWHIAWDANNQILLNQHKFSLFQY